MKNIDNKAYFSTAEAAKILGISRVAVFRRIKSGKLKADRVGRSYVIARESLEIIGEALTGARKKEIDQSMKRILKEYGEALRMLGRE
jgi:excisionase family DNA binding protein